MAVVIWNNTARKEWRKLLLYGLQEFGTTASVRFIRKTDQIEKQLEKHPEAGTPEYLLRHKKFVYRSRHLLPHIKMIYRYVRTSDTVRVVDIWDTRCNPNSLQRRMK